MLSSLRPVCAWLRPAVVNHELTDAPVVQELRRAADSEALVAVYDDGMLLTQRLRYRSRRSASLWTGPRSTFR